MMEYSDSPFWNIENYRNHPIIKELDISELEPILGFKIKVALWDAYLLNQ